jgi:hypothetical protein
VAGREIGGAGQISEVNPGLASEEAAVLGLSDGCRAGMVVCGQKCSCERRKMLSQLVVVCVGGGAADGLVEAGDSVTDPWFAEAWQLTKTAEQCLFRIAL